MTIDRGGLSYPIEVPDRFSVSLQQFILLTNTARQSWADLKAEAKGSPEISKTINSIEKLRKTRDKANKNLSVRQLAERKYAKEVLNSAVNREKANIADERAYRQKRKLATAEELLERAEQKITAVVNKRNQIQANILAVQRRGVDLSQKEAIALGLMEKATARLTAEQKRNLAVRRQLEAARKATPEFLEAQAQLAAQRQINANAVRLRRDELLGLDAQKKTTKNLNDQSTVTNKIFFNLKRIFAVFVAISAVRSGVGLFTNLVSSGLKFNALLEQSELSIASLIASVGELYDANGRVVDPINRLNIAQKLAVKQTEKLRIEALATASTFEELLKSFQFSLAPGLSAGLDLDQIRIVSKQLASAARTIGLDVSQIGEEVRSLLTGNISKRNTLIASFLGIEPEDIRNATRTGKLFEFLQSKLDVFTESSRRSEQTFDGLLSKLKDAFTIVAAEGGKKAFDELKDLFRGISNDLISVNRELGRIELNPTLVQIAANFYEIVRAATREVKRLKETVSGTDLLAISKAIGNIFSGLFTILGGATSGAISFLGSVSFVLNAIVASLQQVSLLLTGSKDGVTNITRLTVKWASVVLSLGISLFAVRKSTQAVLFLLKPILSSLKPVGALLSAASGRLISMVRSAGGLRAGIAALATGIVPFVASLGVALASVLAIAAGIASITGLIDLSETKPVNKAADIISQGARDAKRAAILITQSDSAERTKRLRELDDEELAYEQHFRNQEKNAKSFSDVFQESLDKAQASITKFLAAAQGVNVSPTSELDQWLDDVDAFVQGSSQAVKELTASFSDLDREITAAAESLQLDSSAIGLSSDVAGIIQTRTNQTLKALEKTRDIKREILTIEDRLAGIDASLQDTNLTEDQRKKLETAGLALQSSITVLDKVQKEATTKLNTLATISINQTLKQVKEEQNRELTLLRIQAIQEKNLSSARIEGNERKIATIELQNEIDLLYAQEQQRLDVANKSLAAMRDELQAAKDRLAILKSTPSGEGAPDNTIALQQEQDLVNNLQIQIGLLEEKKLLENQIVQTKLSELQIQQDINNAINTAPFTAGFTQAFIDSFKEVSDGFKVTLDIMKSGITGFSSFIGTSIVSAFDKTNESDILADFGRFLQQMAVQIITTLTQLAITAAALNLASGGLLGPFIQNFAKLQLPGFGLAEGGFVQDKIKKAKGYSTGGSVDGRQLPTPAYRPANIDRRDTVFGWLDPKEYVISGSGVMSAGLDVLDRINRGKFDLTKLREAVGLSLSRRFTPSYARGRLGLASGGPAASLDRSASATRQTQPVQAFIAGGENEVEKFLRSGPGAMQKVLTQLGYRRVR